MNARVRSVIPVLIAFLIVISASILPILNTNTYEVTVTDTKVKVRAKVTRNLVFTRLENGEHRVFSNDINLFMGKLNSSKLQASLKKGTKYRFTVKGFNIPILFLYENIDKVELIE